MALPHQAQIRDKAYLNWVRAGLGLKYTKEGFETFIDNEAKVFHSMLLSKLGQHPKSCCQCTTDNLLPHQQSSCPRRTNCICSKPSRNKRRVCPYNVCGTLFNAIVSEHRFNGPSWKNTSISQWVTDHWEVAKAFTPFTGGYKNIATAAETDFSGLVNIGINMLNITSRHNLTVSSLDGPDDLIKCRTARNEILHNPSQSLSDVQLTDYMNDMKSALQCTAALVNDTVAQQAVSKLTQLETSLFEITDENITEVRQMAVQVIQEEGSKQGEAVKEEGKKQKICVESSGILARKRTLAEGHRQRKRVKVKGIQQVKAVKVAGEKQIQNIQQATSSQAEAKYQEEKNKLKRHLIDTYIAQLQPETLPDIDRLYVRPRIKVVKDDAYLDNAGERKSDRAESEDEDNDTFDTMHRDDYSDNTDTSDDSSDTSDTSDDDNNFSPFDSSDDDSDTSEANQNDNNRNDNPSEKRHNDNKNPDSNDDNSTASDTSEDDLNTFDAKKDKDIKDIFFEEQTQFARIYISGDAGHGKTALCQMLVLAWCQEHSGKEVSSYIPSDFLAVMKKFDVLFYIPLRNIGKDWIISEIIKKQFFDDANFFNMFLKNEYNKSSCLVILDGLDEWVTPEDYEAPMHATYGLLDLGSFTKYTVLTSSRPWKLEELRLGPLEMDRKVKLKGIGRKASERYTENLIDLLNKKKKKTVQRKTQDFKQHIKAKGLQYFLYIPILLKQLIMLWHHDEKQIIGSSKVYLYSAMINHLLMDAWKRNKKKPLMVDGNSQDSELPMCLKARQYCKIHKSLLLSLAHLAFTSAFKEQLVFDHVEAELLHLSEDDIKTCLTAGLLCQEIYGSTLDNEKKKLSFLHKSFQDFLAAVYVIMNPEAAQLPQSCTRRKILDMRYLFVFVSGMDSSLMTSLSQQIQKILEKDEQVKYEMSRLDWDRMKPVQDMLCECVGESRECGQSLPDCLLETAIIYHEDCRYVKSYGVNYDISTSWKNLHHLISTNLSCVKNLFIDVEKCPPRDIFTCLGIVLQCESVQHLTLSLHKSLYQNIEASLNKALFDKWSLSSLFLSDSVKYELCQRYLHSGRITALGLLIISDLKTPSQEEHQRFIEGLKRATQLKTLKLYQICSKERGKKCISHLDLSHWPHLQKLSLKYCDITKVIVSTLLTHCKVDGTSVTFVSHAMARLQTLFLRYISDSQSLNEIVSIVPNLIHLKELYLEEITDADEGCSRHLDLSNCSQLKDLFLVNVSISKVTINTTSLKQCRLGGTPVVFVSHPVTEMEMKLEDINQQSLDGIVSILPHLTKLDLENVTVPENCSSHLDLSNCSKLEEFSLTDCNVTKVTINLSSLTDCCIHGTPVFFVPHPPVGSRIDALRLVNIKDQNSLNEISSILPYLTQLNTLTMEDVSDGGTCHLDLSNCSQLEILKLNNCNVKKVSVNTTSLTDCVVSGSPVYFVPQHVRTKVDWLELRNITDSHSLCEIITLLPQLSRLTHLRLTCLDFGERGISLSPETTHLRAVELEDIIISDREMIHFLNSILSIDHKVLCRVKGTLSEAVATYIPTRFVVKRRRRNSLDFYSHPAAP